MARQSLSGWWHIIIGVGVFIVSFFFVEGIMVFSFIGAGLFLYGLAKVGFKLLMDRRNNPKPPKEKKSDSHPYHNQHNQNTHQHQQNIQHNSHSHQNRQPSHPVFCRSCGNRVGLHDNFCSHCGTRIR